MPKQTDTALKIDIDNLLGEIRESDNNQVEAQLNIARILAAIKEYKLYAPKYTSFKHMVQMELDFAVTAAEKYVSFHIHYKKFGYGRDEMLKLMRQLGWRKVQFCLRGSKKKMGLRAMKNYLEQAYYSQDRQFNFNMRTDGAAEELEKALTPFGLTIDNKTSRRGHLSESLQAMLKHYNELQALAKESNALPEKKLSAKKRAIKAA